MGERVASFVLLVRFLPFGSSLARFGRWRRISSETVCVLWSLKPPANQPTNQYGAEAPTDKAVGRAKTR